MENTNIIARLVFAGTTLFLLFLSYMFYKQIEQLVYSYRELNESNIVKLKLEQTVSALKDAETAQRGYLLTDDSFFLLPFFGSYETARDLLGEVKEATASNPGQQRDLDAISTFVEVRYRTFDNVIRQYKRPELSNEIRKGHLMRGISTMDSIRYRIASIRSAEDEKIGLMQKEKQKYSLLTPVVGFIIILAGLGIMLFSYLRIMKDVNIYKSMLAREEGMNRELQQKNLQLEAYNKELDSFTYIASHDLKEPLRKILTFTSMIQNSEYQNLSDDGKMNFERIQKAAKRMQRLLNDLLNYAKVTGDDHEFERVDMNAVIPDVKRKFSEELKEARGHIQTGGLPVISGLPFQINQLFENLISNSIKFKKDGEPLEIKISSTLTKKQDEQPLKGNGQWYYKVVVEDNGKGFDSAYAEKMFGPFQRVHREDSDNGSGIGLAICKKIIQNHHGFIKAKGEPDRGARFEVFFPT